MNVATIILNYKRAPNIPIIVQALRGGKVKPDEVIIIDNNPESNLQIEGVTLIRCSRNFGCQIRHALAQVAGATHYLFVDDDLNVGPNTLHNFITWHNKLPESILGYYGRIANRQVDSPYTSGSHIYTRKIKKPVKVDIVLGRIHFCRKDKLTQAFTLLEKVPTYPPPGSGMDDILLSLANCYYGYKNYVIPAGPLSFTCDLPDFGVGLYKRKEHYGMRNRATRLLLETLC